MKKVYAKLYVGRLASKKYNIGGASNKTDHINLDISSLTDDPMIESKGLLRRSEHVTNFVDSYKSDNVEQVSGKKDDFFCLSLAEKLSRVEYMKK